MSKRLPTIWNAEPHTIAKIEILKYYLKAWFRILAATRKGEKLLYVDGFAGPGVYRNHPEGSPTAAIRIALEAVQELGARFIAKEIRCAFIESNTDRCEHLGKTIQEFETGHRVKITLKCCEFASGIEELRAEIPQPFCGEAPLFVFADPFGATQVPFSSLANCMQSDTAELLINLDADGIGRIFAAGNPKRDEQLTDLFGTTEWQQKLTARDPKKLSVQILDLYKEQLRKLPGVDFVWSFAMRGRNDSINYHLVFATKHPLGMQKMKEAMKAIDSSGSFSFSDAHRDQQVLFRDDDAAIYAKLLFDTFQDQEVHWEPVRNFALNETPFINPKAMLATLERHHKLEVETHGNVARKHGSFPEERIKLLRFGRFGPTSSQQELDF